MPEVAPPRAAAELIARLPRTFGPALNEQIKGWDLLFPAEQRRLRAQLDWLAGLPPPELKALFAPILDLESRMELPRWDSATTGMSIEGVGVLARSPLYPQWRAEVEKVFAKIDDQVKGALPAPRNRLVVCFLPPRLPLPQGPLWPDLEKHGRPVQLEEPFGSVLPRFAADLAKRPLPQGMENIEATWIFECDSQLSALAETTSANTLSWTAMATVRREFLSRLNNISRTLKSVDQTHEDLKRLDITRWLGPSIAASPRMREFTRALLLSGNGSLIFNNSFIQWGASEALRRAEPLVLIAGFGVRQKLKPFSSAVLFEDQHRSNPTPDANDPAGSVVDGVFLANYVYLAEQRVSAYRDRTLTLMAASDLNRVLVLGPPAPLPASPRISARELTEFALTWLAS